MQQQAGGGTEHPIISRSFCKLNIQCTDNVIYYQISRLFEVCRDVARLSVVSCNNFYSELNSFIHFQNKHHNLESIKNRIK